MSETKKTKQIPNNTTNYIVFGKEHELEQVKVAGQNEQNAVHNIPGIPMEIQVDPHTFEIAPNGEIIRKGKDGKKLPGKVTNKKVVDAVKREQEAER